MEEPAPEQHVATPAVAFGRESRRVLLVEDDADQRHLIAWMLRAEGCDVLEAASGIELLDWIAMATSTPQSRRFDAIVSDVNMPDLTAIEVFSGWRYGGWPAPLILVTASDDPTVHFEAHALGASTVLAKPVRPDDLRHALERAFAQRQGADEQPAEGEAR